MCGPHTDVVRQNYECRKSSSRGGDVPLVIVDLETITEALRKSDTKAGEVADRIERKIGAQCTTTTIEGDENTTEAAVRAYAEALRKK